MWRRCQASPPHAAKKQLTVTQSQPSSGTACAIYGWRQKSAVPLAGGVLLIVATYFLDSALWMSVASVAILGAMYFGRHLGEGAG